MPRRFLICLAFATWCFLDTWVEYAEGGSAYFARHSPMTAVVMPVLCLEALIAAALLAGWVVCRRFHALERFPVRIGFLLLCYWPVGIASVAALRLLPFDVGPVIPSAAFWPVILLGGAAVVCAWPRAAGKLMRGAMLYSWPLLLLIVAQAMRVTVLRYSADAYPDGVMAQSLPSQNGAHPRVVWVVFDELSQPLLFDHRPPGLQLTHFDRLKQTSFSATEAHSSSNATQLSLPSLILGERVIEARSDGPRELLIRTAADGNWRSLSTAPNLFDAARALGVNSAVAGWHHPYGRLFARSLTRCYWTAGWLRPGVEERFASLDSESALWDRFRLQMEALPAAGHLPGLSPLRDQRREKIERFLWLRDRSIELVSDASVGLALIHLPVPHPPAISRDGRTLTADGTMGYAESLALADETLGLLRAAMERSGQWEQTAVVVSSDHGWRPQLWRHSAEWGPGDEAIATNNDLAVPFLVKLPGQKSPAVYAKPFQTLATRRLITGILRGEVREASAIADVLDRATQ